jgi:hypothetical protein
VTAYLESWHLRGVADVVAPLFARRRRPTIGRMVLVAISGILTTWLALCALVVALVMHLAA